MKTFMRMAVWLSMAVVFWPVIASAEEKLTEIVTNEGIAFSRIDKDSKQLEVYDTVAAYDDHATTLADCARHSIQFKGAKWCFSSSVNRKKFEEAMKDRNNRYVPFGGGYCARGLSNGNFAKGDPRTHVRAGTDMVLNGSWAVADTFWDKASSLLAAGRVTYTMALRHGDIVPNDSAVSR
jgi:hypothetical protein